MNLTHETQIILTVERCIGDLKRGFPVVIFDNSQKLLVIAAENAQGDCLAASDSVSMVISATRANALVADKPYDKPVSFPVDNQNVIADICGHSGNTPPLPQSHIKEASSLETSALQLVKLAQLLPAVLCKNVTDEDLSDFLQVDSQCIASYKDTIALELTEACRTPLVLKGANEAEIIAFRPNIGGQEHYAIVIGKPGETPLIRVHSSCYTGDLLDSLECDCRDQLHTAIARMAEEGGGIILYMMQEGRDIGLINKLRAYALKAQGHDTVDANEILGFDDDERLFLPAVAILNKLNIKCVNLLTNNPRKAKGLEEHGIVVKQCLPHIMEAHEHNQHYLKTKAERLGHRMDGAEE